MTLAWVGAGGAIGSYRKNVMTQMHVAKDAAAMAGTLGSGIALWAGASFRAIFAALGVLLLLLMLAAFRLPLPDPTPSTGDRGRAADGGEAQHLWLVRGVLLATLFVGLVSLTDAALAGYSSIYLRAVLGSGALVGAAGLAVFHLARMLGDWGSTAAIGRVGERGVLVAAGTGLAVGIALLVAAESPVPGTLGLLLIGLFTAPIAPISYSLASRAAPDRAGQAVSLAWSAFYAAFLVGPLLVGVLADLVSLRAALALFILTSLSIAAIAYREL